MKKTIDYQQELYKKLPKDINHLEYKNKCEFFIQIDNLLESTGLERQFMEKMSAEKPGKNKWQHYSLILRCTLSRYLLKLNYRELSIQLSDSALLRWFCRLPWVDEGKAPSRSSLCRYEQMVPFEIIEELMVQLNNQARDKFDISLDEFYADSTCLEANIHHSTDWCFLVDCVKTLIKGIKLIRQKGLVHRMKSPDYFISEMNALSMSMTSCRRQKGAPKKRKKIFRQMRDLLRKVARHSQRHLDLLSEENSKDFTLPQKMNLENRLTQVLEQVEWIIYQGHERIIGERKVKDSDKILSVYDKDIQTIVRGKASGKTEFGNLLYIAEQKDGLIVDWNFFKDKKTHEKEMISHSIEFMKEKYNTIPKCMTADAAFSSPENTQSLKLENIINHIKPKSIAELEECLQNPLYRKSQKRRAQTEGRIAILKTWFMRQAKSIRGYEKRKKAVAMGIFAHNLWVLARKNIADELTERTAA